MDDQDFKIMNELLLAARGENNSCITELETERARVRVLREALEELLAYVETGYGDFESDEGAQAHEALATTAPEAGDGK